MVRKIPMKLVMQYRDQGFSRNMIAKTHKGGRISASVNTAVGIVHQRGTFVR